MPEESLAAAGGGASPPPACEWSAAMASAHRALSPVDLAFREAARASPELLDRETFRAMAADGVLVGKPVQPWLTFLGSEKRAELAAASLGVCALIKSIPQRIFGGDAAAIARFYGLAPAFVDVCLAEPNGLAGALARGDFIATAEGLRCIEFNINSRIGGFETAVVVERAWQVPAVARFLAGQGIAGAAPCTDTVRELFAHLLAEVRGKGLAQGGEINVAICRNRREPKRQPALQAWFDRELQAVCGELAPGLTGRVVDAYPDELVVWQESLFCGQLRIQAVIVWAEETPKAVYRAFKSDRIVLFNGPVEALLSNKRNLALLSENAERCDLFSAAERALIDRHVPWTRQVPAGVVSGAGLTATVDYRGEAWPLGELLAARREELVLKKGVSYGGLGVAMGRFTPPERWLELARQAAAEGGWVVQEIAESLPFLFQAGARGCAAHDVIWGPFVFGDRYGGAFLRMQPKSAGEVVNLTQHATQGFLVEV